MEYTIILSEQHLMTIDRALQEAPFRLAYPVIQALNEQIAEQNATASEPAKGSQGQKRQPKA